MLYIDSPNSVFSQFTELFAADQDKIKINKYLKFLKSQKTSLNPETFVLDDIFGNTRIIWFTVSAPLQPYSWL